MKNGNWSQKSLTMKILMVLGLLLSVAILVLAALQIFGVWDNAICVFEPLLGLLMLVQAAENWKTNRRVAWISLGAAIFVFAVAAFILL